MLATRLTMTMITAASILAASWAGATKAAGSQERSRYATVLYSLIFMHTRPPHAYYVVTGRGTAYINFCVNREGKLLEVAREPGAKPTGYDEGAKRIIRKAARFFPAPPADIAKERLCFTAPMRFGSS